MDITEFLTARLNEEQQFAEAASRGPWQACRNKDLPLVHADVWGWTEHEQDYGEPLAMDVPRDTAVFIAHHDPARALDDVTVKRYLLNEYKLAADFDVDAAAESALNADDEEAQLLQLAEVAAKEAGKNVMLGVVKALASAYALHPDYDPAWSLWPHVRALAEKAKG